MSLLNVCFELCFVQCVSNYRISKKEGSNVNITLGLEVKGAAPCKFFPA